MYAKAKLMICTLQKMILIPCLGVTLKIFKIAWNITCINMYKIAVWSLQMVALQHTRESACLWVTVSWQAFFQVLELLCIISLSVNIFEKCGFHALLSYVSQIILKHGIQCGQSQGIYIEGSFACFMSWDFVCIFLACCYVKPLNTVIDVIDWLVLKLWLQYFDRTAFLYGEFILNLDNVHNIPLYFACISFFLWLLVNIYYKMCYTEVGQTLLQVCSRLQTIIFWT